jgi:hypothetical protein
MESISTLCRNEVVPQQQLIFGVCHLSIKDTN